MTTKAVLYDRGSPKIVVVNESDWVPNRELEHVVGALQMQVDRDFFPLWGWRAKLSIQKNAPENGAMCIILLNEPGKDDEGAEGYHFSEDGLPMTYIFTRDEKGKAVENYGVTMSHEVLEMIADPGVNLYADGYYITKTGRHMKAFIPYEVCDPVQESTYEIRGVTVSDFVVPEWFEYERARNSMPFSFLDAISEPFELAPDGYTDAMVGRRIRTQWGAKANKKRRRHRHKARLKKAARRF